MECPPRRLAGVLVFGQLLARPPGYDRLTKLVLMVTEHGLGTPAAGRFHCMSEFVCARAISYVSCMRVVPSEVRGR